MCPVAREPSGPKCRSRHTFPSPPSCTPPGRMTRSWRACRLGTAKTSASRGLLRGTSEPPTTTSGHPSGEMVEAAWIAEGAEPNGTRRRDERGVIVGEVRHGAQQRVDAEEVGVRRAWRRGCKRARHCGRLAGAPPRRSELRRECKRQTRQTDRQRDRETDRETHGLSRGRPN
eukprot:scaffold52910_cov55-Phaeocystis_antarctica.AAC.1